MNKLIEMKMRLALCAVMMFGSSFLALGQNLSNYCRPFLKGEETLSKDLDEYEKILLEDGVLDQDGYMPLLTKIVANEDFEYIRSYDESRLNNLGVRKLGSCLNNYILVSGKSQVLDNYSAFIDEWERNLLLTEARLVNHVELMIQYFKEEDFQQDFLRYRILALLYFFAYSDLDQWTALSPTFQKPLSPIAVDSLTINVDAVGDIRIENETDPTRDLENLIFKFVQKNPTAGKVKVVVAGALPYEEYLTILKRIKTPYNQLKDSVAQSVYGLSYKQLNSIKQLKEVKKRLFQWVTYETN